VFPSVWLLAFSMFTFFALAAAKRLGELSDADAAGRTVTRRGYTVEDRRILSQMAMSAGYVGVLVLALYIDEPNGAGALRRAPAVLGRLRAADLLDQPAGAGGQPG
jgi:4-hydroxybenzoate polyprenyltransferase